MTTQRLGKRPPRYTFVLNPYTDIRLSKCPRCDKLTHKRKFALFIHVVDFGGLVLGKTCRYCTSCEFIGVHQDELEPELARCLGQLAPDALGKPYVVFGTVDKKVWQQGLTTPQNAATLLEALADFKSVRELKVEGGWQAAKKA